MSSAAVVTGALRVKASEMKAVETAASVDLDVAACKSFSYVFYGPFKNIYRCLADR